MEFYDEYQEYFRESNAFFKLTNPKMEFSATNYTHVINEE
jgi:hypothetical protein